MKGKKIKQKYENSARRKRNDEGKMTKGRKPIERRGREEEGRKTRGKA